MPDTRVPGVWSNGAIVVVLSKVAYVMWATFITDSANRALVTKIECRDPHAEAVSGIVVFMDGMNFTLEGAVNRAILVDNAEAASFMQALNLYWETRS